MKITETTTFAELMQARRALGVEYLAVNFHRPSETYSGIVCAEVPGRPGLTTIFGSGSTEADAINDAFSELLRQRAGGSHAPPIPAV